MVESPPNILWITLDSVRADHTSLHDYHRDTTPHLARIASAPSGLNFEHGISEGVKTPTVIPSILTGLYPSRHKMIGTRDGDVIPGSINTAPELLAEQGYRTIGVAENPFAGEAKGIDKLFDYFTRSSLTSYQDALSKEFRSTLLRYLFNTRSHGPGLTLSGHAKQNSFYTTDIAKEKIRSVSNAEEPFFCYVHYNDPHHPYIPPLSYRSEFTDKIEASTEEAVAFAQEFHDNLRKWIAEDIPITESQWEMIFAMYDATIKYTDECVGELFDFVKRTSNNTIIVITADHGDLFGEYGLLGHIAVPHDGLIHVPLITHGIENIEHHTTEPTQHIDIMQTLLSVADADVKQFQGCDLRRENRSKAVSQHVDPSVDNGERSNYDHILKHNSSIDLSHLPKSMAISVRNKKFKFVRTDECARLYRLPNEMNDVKKEYTEEFDKFCSFTDQFLKTKGTPLQIDSQKGELSKQAEQQLRDMGYLL